MEVPQAMSFLVIDRVPRRAIPWLGGSVALAVGMLVYLCDRPVAHASLLPHLGTLAGHSWFGWVGGWLPSFVHPLAFSLFTSALLAPQPRLQYRVCAFWFAVNAAFEVCQLPQICGPLTDALRRSTAQGPIALSIERYVERGTFDPADLVAAALGAALAGAILHRPRIPGKPW